MVAPRTGAEEITVAENQTEYSPIVAAVYGDNGDAGPITLLTRWRLSDDDRARIASGEDVYLALLTFGGSMQPVSLQVGPDGWVAPEAQP